MMKTKQRQAAWDRTGGRCFYCRCQLLPDSEVGPVIETKTAVMVIDHMTPVANGGTSLIENLAPSCRGCNAQKHNRTVEEYRHHLLRNGIIPQFFGTPEVMRDWLFVASRSSGSVGNWRTR